MLIESGIGEFSDAQAVTAGATASENVINLVAARQQLGVGNELFLWLRTNVAANFDGTESYLFAFEVDDNESFSSPRCVFVVADTDGSAIVTGDPESTPLKTAGKVIFSASLPQNVDEQYGRWVYTLADGNGTASITIDAALGPDRPVSDRKKDQIYVSNVGNP